MRLLFASDDPSSSQTSSSSFSSLNNLLINSDASALPSQNISTGNHYQSINKETGLSCRNRLGSIEESFDLNLAHSHDDSVQLLSLYAFDSTHLPMCLVDGSSKNSSNSPVKKLSESSPPLPRSSRPSCDSSCASVMNDSVLVSTNRSTDDSNMEHSSLAIDYIEENKVIIPGIHVRAAKLSKLIEILIESFGTCDYFFSDFEARLSRILKFFKS